MDLDDTSIAQAESELQDWRRGADDATKQSHRVKEGTSIKMQNAFKQVERFSVDAGLEARVVDQNVLKSINPCPSLLLRHAPMLKLRWVSALLQPGEERDDGCSDGEHDEDYSCGDSLPRSACQSI